MKKKYIPLSKFDLERGVPLEFRYTTSKGRDTYGYNICTLYVYGDKVSSCNGGGYDMRGTALGDWIEMQFPEELKTLEAGTSKMVKGKHGEYQKRSGFYGLFFHRAGMGYGEVSHYQPGDRVSLDGGCGIRCMEDILTALGYEMRYIPNRSKNVTQYLLQPVNVQVTA